MAETVIDASIAVKWVLAESDSAEARSKAAAKVMRGDRFLILDMAVSEVANAIATRYRKGLIDEASAVAAWQRFLRAPVDVFEAKPYLADALQFSMKHPIAIYDTAFVAAVRNRACDGVTADVPLYRRFHGDVPAIRLLKDW